MSYTQYGAEFFWTAARVTITNFNGTADNVIRNQEILNLSMTPADNPPPDNAVALILQFDCAIKGSNSIGTRHEFNTLVYEDHAGTLLSDSFALTAYEHAAVATNIWFGGGQITMFVPVTGPNLEITTRFFDSGGGPNSQVQGVNILGYYTQYPAPGTFIQGMGH